MGRKNKPAPKSAPVAPATGAVSPPARTPRRRGLWLLLVVLALLAWQRGWWWTPFMHARAEKYLRAHEAESALKWIEATRWLVANDPDNWRLEARAARQLGDMNRVRQALQRADDAGLDRQLLLREQILARAQSGQMREAELHLGRLLADGTERVEEVCEAYVYGYLRMQRLGDARRILDAWIDDRPEDAWAYLLRGRVRSVARDFSGAEDDYRRSIELDPLRPEPRVELAKLLREQNRSDEAIPLLEACLDRPGFEARARVELAYCRKLLGETDAARSLLNAAITIDPEHLDALKALGTLDFELQRFAEAAEHLQSVYRLAPYDDESRYFLAQSLDRLSRSAEAAEHYRYVEEARAAMLERQTLNDVLASDPRNVEAIARMGELHLRYSNPQEGVIRLLTVLELEPGHKRARELLAEYYAARAEQDPSYRSQAEEFSTH